MSVMEQSSPVLARHAMWPYPYALLNYELPYRTSKIVCIERLGTIKQNRGYRVGRVLNLVKMDGGGGVMCLLNKEPNNFLVISEHSSSLALDSFLGSLK